MPRGKNSAHTSKHKRQFPAQYQRRQPGRESLMHPKPKSENKAHVPSGKLNDRVALITGGDSGIGRAIAILFAKEGADIVSVYLEEHSDSEETKRLVEKEGRRYVGIAGDVGDESFCKEAVKKAIKEFGRFSILINNAAEQHSQEKLEDISAQQLERTFRTNIFSYFFMTKAALPHLRKGSVIINTTSVTAYRGSPKLLDYSSTKGAVVSFTRSLSEAIVERGIRVNAVAPGPVWTPLIPSSFPPEKVATFGSDVPMKRAGQPEEIAPAFLFLACDDSAYMTGQVLHPNGGEIINT